ncbi:polysaccharide pyruvyl transferase family protein [Vibrio sp. ABG19]|uniref:polysaccharide pyruvyl transferase family protein n=1 Tax=Vibrio sp. ABG19 TaxID=2817385 RepID=UPI00249F07A8|nr:polysaccharide pyruvyl transferase family protein [Vibrio sp. ABG19]WGY48419.1 polysaccharide pyruvyl transferase family protein [Vibrio sp. ABG19]
MYLEYCTTELGNFGDDLNPWLFPQMMPKAFENKDDKIAFIGIGTILDQKRVERERLNANRANIVFSSGAGFGQPPQLNDSWHIYCVRGQHTANQLGISKDKVIADGAYLLRNLLDYKNIQKTTEVGFIPHHSSENYLNWENICKQCGFTFISMRQPVDQVLQQMMSCKTIVTEAMHGAIVSDALRIPWIPVSYSPKFMLEKWQDFSGALDIDLTVTKLPFYVDTPLNIGQSVEHIFKRKISKLGFGPDKWIRLPNAYRTASTMQLDQLCEILTETAHNGKAHQSSDIVVENITQKLNDSIGTLYRDYLAGKFNA